MSQVIMSESKSAQQRRVFFFPLSLFLLFHIILEGIVSHCGVFYETDLPRRRRARLHEKQGVSLTLQVGPDTGPDTTAGSGHGDFGLVSATCNPQFWASAGASALSQFSWFGPPWKVPSPK